MLNTQPTRRLIPATGFRSNEPLTNDQLQRYASSIFADSKHDSRSDKYTHIKTIDLVERLRTEGFYPVAVQQSGTTNESKRNHLKHMIRFRNMNDFEREGRQRENMQEVVMINSHDGTSSYKLMSGLYRLICSNGMIAWQEDIARRVRVPHKGDVINNVIEGVYKVVDQGKKTIEDVELFKSLELSREEQEIFADSARKLRFDDTQEVRLDHINHPRRMADKGNDLWLALNRVQENFIRGGLPYYNLNERGQRVNRQRTREIRNVDQNVKINQALWQLANEMAKLKGAA